MERKKDKLYSQAEIIAKRVTAYRSKTPVDEKKVSHLETQREEILEEHKKIAEKYKKTYQLFLENEKELKSEFEAQFNEHISYILENIERIINVKTFYMLEQLWFMCSKSKSVKAITDKMSKDKTISIENFIKFQLKNINTGASQSDDVRKLKNFLEEME
jgi:hypothetical protein